MRLLLLLIPLTAWANTGKDLNRPALTQDLGDPPKLEICMRDLLGEAILGLEVVRFRGPFIVATHRDRLYYEVFSGSRERMKWYFTTGDGGRWHYFQYEGPGGIMKTGAYANSLKRETELVTALPLPRKVLGKPDLSPCGKHLGY